jgi:hypothetical protein
MADFNIRPVATDIKPVQGMSLADMVNMARGVQQYQQTGQLNPLELERAKTELSRLQQLMPEEIKRAQAEANVSVGTERPRITSSEQAAQTATIGTQSAQLDFANKQVNAVANRLTSLINNPLIIATEQNPNAVDPQKLMGIVKKYGEEQAGALGIPKDKADQLLQPYLEQAMTNPAGIRQFLKDKLLSTLDQGSRIGAMQPSGIGVNTGAGGATVQTGQFGPYAPGQALPGTTFETQLPPTTEVVTPTGGKQLLGPMSQRGNVPAVTGLGPAQSALLTAGGETIGGDFKTTVAEAKDAPQRIAIFQNIKKFAPDSFTGVGGQRKELAAGILNAVGISAYEAEKVNTEELAKNSALLALAGGNTDAARALAEVATPNKKLNEKAILAIADQMIGIEKMKQARVEFLSPVANDAVAYAEKKRQFDSLADPRLFQEMTKEDVAKLKASMSPEKQTEMLNKIKLAKQLGIIK